MTVGELVEILQTEFYPTENVVLVDSESGEQYRNFSVDYNNANVRDTDCYITF